MQVNPLDTRSTSQATAALVRVIAGNATALPVGELLRATVTRVGAGTAELLVNGQPLTVRGGGGDLQAGTSYLVRVPAGSAADVVEVVGRAAPTARITAGDAKALPVGELVPATVTRVSGGIAEVVVNGKPLTVQGADLQPGTAYLLRAPAGAAPNTVEVVARAPATGPRIVAGDVRVLPSGEPVPATVTRTGPGTTDVLVNGQPLTLRGVPDLQAGSVYLLRVPAGGLPGAVEVVGRVPPAIPDGAPPVVAVASAVLRNTRPPDAGALVGPLLGELAGLPTAAAPIGEAARAVLDILRGYLPDGRPPNAAELKALVETGGLVHEAKQARGETTPDLKGRLVELVQSADRLGLSEAVPAARTAFHAVEAQQALNVLAQSQNSPYVLQIPIPDGDAWKTVYLALEKDRAARTGPDGGGGFRVLMHVHLDAVGETWVEAGFAGDRFRAALYVDGADVRERFRSELPALRSALADAGFREVLLDVRPTADLTPPQRQRGAAMVAGLPESGHVLDMRA